MKYRYSSWPLRLTAFVLAALCLAGMFLSGVVVVNGLNQGLYFSKREFQTTWQCAELVRNEGWEIIGQFRRNEHYTKWEKLLGGSNLRFILIDEFTGDVVASYVEGLDIKVPKNMADNLYLYEYNTNMELGEADTELENVYVCDYYFCTDIYGGEWNGFSSFTEELGWGDVAYQVEVEDGVPTEVEVEMVADVEAASSYQILYLLPRELNWDLNDRFVEACRVYSLYRDWKEEAAVVLGVCLAGLLASVLFLLILAGRRPGQEELHRSWLQRIPADLLLVLGILAGAGVIACFCVVVDTGNNSHITVNELSLICGLAAAAAAACGLVVLAALYGCVVHGKARSFWRSMAVYRILAWIWRPFHKVFCWVGGKAVLGLRSVGMVPRAVIVVLGVLFAELLLLTWLVNAWTPEIPLVFLVLFNTFLVLAVIWGFAQMKLLQNAAKTLAGGDLDSQLDTSRMYWDFKQHGEYLNAIANGMNKAVEQRMKSERLKTELITNVSHDIKTPLTSIVNYVDLLQKPHTEAEEVQYLEVLDRQSKRLKRLTENLVEASKASTGNMAVDLAPTSVLELVNQAVEEYRDRLEAGKLEIVTSLRGDLTVMADGKLMWRILDNLLNNVIKYALAGTRVYVTAQKQGGQVIIAVKNISRDSLNVDADELMERFVRGDSSRHTEGSGLGLNIARSLTQLQHGQFDLTVDGDLFKAEISLPAV